MPTVEAVVAYVFSSYQQQQQQTPPSSPEETRAHIDQIPRIIADLKHELGLDITDEQVEEFVGTLPTDGEGCVSLGVFKSAFFQSPDNSPDRAQSGFVSAQMSAARSPHSRHNR